MADAFLFSFVDYNVEAAGDDAPGTTGNARIDWVQQTISDPESGDGVLLRATVTAVGNGISPVLFGSFEYPFGDRSGVPGVLWVEADIADDYTIGEVNEAAIVVGAGSCPASPPSSIPTPSPTQRPSPTVTASQAPASITPTPFDVDASATPAKSATPTKVQPSAFPPTGRAESGAGDAIAPWLVALALIAMCGGWFAVARARR
jgi:hypothetical protein